MIANYNLSRTYDFGTAVLRPQADTWQTTESRENGRIIESFRLVSKPNVTDADIRSAVNQIEQLAERARLFHTYRTVPGSVWFHQTAAGELNGADQKRALIYDIRLTPLRVGPYGPTLGGTPPAAFYEMEIERSNWFERYTSAESAVLSGSISSVGGTVGLGAINDSNNRYASLPGRIRQFELTSTTGAIEEVWVGILPSIYGHSDFRPRWDLKYYDSLGYDTLEAADSETLSGTVLQTTFEAIPGMVRRAVINLDSIVTGNTTHMIGEYLVLLRCRVTAASTNIGLQLLSGYDQTLTDIYSPTVLSPVYGISNQLYKFVELGVITIPSFGWREPWLSNNLLNRFSLELRAERVYGTGYLRCDCFVLIPYRHFLHVAKAEGRYISVYTSELGEIIGVLSESGEVSNNLEIAVNDWEYPHNGGVLVVAAERKTQQWHLDTVSFTMNYRERWRVHAR